MMVQFSDIALINIDGAIQIIDSIKDNTMFGQLQVLTTTAIHNAVHTIVDFYERIDKSSLSPEEDELFRAFMYVNNQIKHDTNLQFVTYNVCGSMYPYDYPFRYGPPGVMWADFADHGRSSARGKRMHYDKMLMNKEVKSTLITVKSVINKLKDSLS